jgi:type II secretory pathway predicted ATPase ExeA
MYQDYYGLHELPFDLTPNPRYLFFTGKHREALSNLQYGILGRRGITLLIGEAGTGKTTLVRAALQSDQLKGAECLYLSNPTLTRTEFLEFLAAGFALSPQAATSKTTLLAELQRTLVERRANGMLTALVVDEAQALPLDLLEEIRLLANIETNTDKLLPVVLAGQPQLSERLNDPALKQLKQRVALRCDLQPLTLKETLAYVSRRIRIAGGDSASLFTLDALELIHRCAQGIPRTISVICDNALVTGFAAARRPVDAEIVYEVCRDFDLVPPARVPDPRTRGAIWSEAPARVAPIARELLDAAGVRDTPRDGLFAWVNRRRFSFFGA